MSGRDIRFGNDAVELLLGVKEDGRITLEDLGSAGTVPRTQGSPYFDSSAAPLCEVRLSGEGNIATKTSRSLVGTYLGARLKYQNHNITENQDAGTKTLHTEIKDEETGVTVVSHLTIYSGLPIVRSSATIRNDGTEDIIVTQVTSFVFGGVTRLPQWWANYSVSRATNTWFREAQWKDFSLPEVGVDDNAVYQLEQGATATMSAFSVSNRGTFSTQGHLPMGMLKRNDGSDTWLWQVEASGSWEWEIGDYRDDVYVALTGPNSNNHDWRQRLAPGTSFTTVTAAICHVAAGQGTAFGFLTSYRRRIRRPHPDYEGMPIFFNDYMNCLMGDPTYEKIMALVGPVARSGAEYFVIDAGWYADELDWWDDVGAWEPSEKRFPNGFENLLRDIRAAGLKVGLWIEAEVVGIRSPIRNQLPDEAFFMRDGRRVLEKNRYQLDFRHPAVISRMDAVIDRLVSKYGVEYLKFDYNIGVTEGTDVSCSSAGAGQLEHNRAYLSWVEALLDKYPGLIIENCSSGAQRIDYAMNAVHTLQSTSDQQNPVKYAAVSAAIHTAIAPEQGASWAYPQPDWEDEINAMTVVNSLLGRVHLSGRLDLLSAEQLRLVYDGMDVYKAIRGHLATSTPFWPLGLAQWHDDWLATGLQVSGLEDSGCAYVAVWRRGGEESHTIPVPCASGGQGVVAKVLYPEKLPIEANWDSSTSSLRVTLTPLICARLLAITWVIPSG
jgi:alpha-galactosidase